MLVKKRISKLLGWAYISWDTPSEMAPFHWNTRSIINTGSIYGKRLTHASTRDRPPPVYAPMIWNNENLNLWAQTSCPIHPSYLTKLWVPTEVVIRRHYYTSWLRTAKVQILWRSTIGHPQNTERMSDEDNNPDWHTYSRNEVAQNL